MTRNGRFLRPMLLRVAKRGRPRETIVSPLTVFWIIRTGAQWRDLPSYFGPEPKGLFADGRYDVDAIRNDMKICGGIAIIPTRRNRKSANPNQWSYLSVAKHH